MDILYAALVLGGMGLLFGVALTVVSKVFAVPANPKREAVRELLPGANCGGCGFPGCAGLAAAIVAGEAPVNACAPAGAANAARLYRNGSLDEITAQRLAIICNNAGPAFLFGIVGNLFSQIKFPWLLWAVHIVSSLVVARFLPGEPVENCKISAENHRSLPFLLNRTIETMASICGWVVLFRLILTFLERWFLWMLPDILAILLTGCLELSNGCLALSRIQSEEIRFYIAAFLLGFGGLCVTMQTLSVCEGLQLRGYVGAKLLHGSVSFLLAFVVYRGKTALMLLAVLLLAPLFRSFPRKSEKRGSNSTAGVV